MPEKSISECMEEMVFSVLKSNEIHYVRNHTSVRDVKIKELTISELSELVIAMTEVECSRALTNESDALDTLIQRAIRKGSKR